ncbi:MAG TPA: hypothetical protein VMS01_04290 [Stellaceae bacterium]|nr:hypothetical protein [Stellaceae bacterium]
MYVDRMLRPAYRSREERTQHSKARENARRAAKLREQAQKCPS